MKVGNLLRGVGGKSKLNVASEVIDIPYEYIDYVIYNYNHNAVPKETLERVLAVMSKCPQCYSELAVFTGALNAVSVEDLAVKLKRIKEYGI